MPRSLLAALAVFILAACRRAPSPPTPASPVAHDVAPPRSHGPREITPHRELIPFGPYGTGANACTAMLYEWDPAHPRCTLQLNHCTVNERGETLCLSLADERTVACGADFDACGERVTCRCPTGAAPTVPDPPGMVALHPTPDGTRWSSNEGGVRCEARSSEIPGTRDAGLSPLCVVAIRECSAGDVCNDRVQMLSCGVRAPVCGRPTRCLCP